MVCARSSLVSRTCVYNFTFPASTFQYNQLVYLTPLDSFHASFIVCCRCVRSSLPHQSGQTSRLPVFLSHVVPVRSQRITSILLLCRRIFAPRFLTFRRRRRVALCASVSSAPNVTHFFAFAASCGSSRSRSWRSCLRVLPHFAVLYSIDFRLHDPDDKYSATASRCSLRAFDWLAILACPPLFSIALTDMTNVLFAPPVPPPSHFSSCSFIVKLLLILVNKLANWVFYSARAFCCCSRASERSTYLLRCFDFQAHASAFFASL